MKVPRPSQLGIAHEYGVEGVVCLSLDLWCMPEPALMGTPTNGCCFTLAPWSTLLLGISV